MRNSVAILVGTILYIDGRVFGYDFTKDEAAEYVLSMQDQPGAPTQVIFNLGAPKPTKRKRSQTGWPTI